LPLSFDQARACVIREVRPRLQAPPVETIRTLDSAGRILAEDIPADRDYPPFPRAVRDGFAVRASDLPGELRITGEVRAGGSFSGVVGAGETVEIMTGAPLPEGADAVVMVEHTERSGDRVRISRTAVPGENFNARGSETAQGALLLRTGQRLDFTSIAALAMVGRHRINVYRKPRVGILPTGDEIVDVSGQPGPFQIRNSNAWSLAAQVARAGGEPEILPIARDNSESTRASAELGLRPEIDLLLLSGGVSAGKYDIVERVLADLGAHFFFDRVAIQPGQPLVFGAAQGKFFFGLPGNPASTMMTFELFARAAVELLGGAIETPLPFLRAKLTREVHQKQGLTRFLPARLSEDGATIEPVPSRGSGDVGALTRSNAFLVTDPDRELWHSGEDIQVLIK
jgi:molybdopterin molybdotransferase